MTRSIALALSLLVVAAPFAAAQDTGWKWDPKKKRVPAVGDRIFEEGTETTDNKLKIQGPNEEPTDKGVQFTLAYRVVRECLAIEGDKVSKERIKVERWQRKPLAGAASQEPAESSLEGKTILVEGTGAKKVWKIEKDAEKVTDTARLWIEKDLVKKENGKADAVLDPKEPLAPDSEWTIDPKAVAKDMFGFGEIDPALSSAKGKLSNVRVENGAHVGTVELKLTLALKQFPASPLAWKEGGVLEVTISGENVLDQAKVGQGKMRMELKLKGKVDQESPKGGSIKIDMDMHITREGTTGDAGPAR
jgi:hypothetical protein